MRIVIVGAGGLGLFYGGMLARGGMAVTYLTRGDSLGQLRRQGVTVTRLDTGERFIVPVAATDDAASIGPVDCVLVCVKMYDLDVVARQLPPLLGTETVVIPVQNGIDAAERIAAQIGPEPVLGGVAGVSATRTMPGSAEVPFVTATLQFGELAGGASARTTRLEQVFAAAGLPSVVSTAIRAELWRKFAFVCGGGSVCALTRLPLAAVLGCPEAYEMVRGIEAEVRALATASGVTWHSANAEQLKARLTRDVTSAGAYPSQYYDLIAGRRLEIDYFNGTAVRLGHTLGIPTPLNFAIYAALKPYADGPPTLPTGRPHDS
jgi:2-dehydropantoate 2-reductase